MAALTLRRVGAAELRPRRKNHEPGRQARSGGRVKGHTEHTLSVYIHSSNMTSASSGVNSELSFVRSCSPGVWSPQAQDGI